MNVASLLALLRMRVGPRQSGDADVLARALLGLPRVPERPRVPVPPRRIVRCSHCGEEPYEMRAGVWPGDPILAADFTPARPDVAQPTDGAEIRCPLCGAYSLLNDLVRLVADG